MDTSNTETSNASNIDITNIGELINSTIAGKIRVSFDTCMLTSGNSQSISFSDIYAPGCNLVFRDIENRIDIIKYEPKCDNPNTTTITSDVFLSEVKSEVKRKLGIENGIVHAENIINQEINSDLMLNIATCMQSNLNSQKIDFSKLIINCYDNDPVIIHDGANFISQLVTLGCTRDNTQKFVNDISRFSNIDNSNNSNPDNTGMIIGIIFGIIAFVAIIIGLAVGLRKHFQSYV